MQQPCGQGTKQSSSGLLAADWQAKQEKQSLSFKTTINKETTLEFAAIRCYPLLRRRRFRRYPLLSVSVGDVCVGAVRPSRNVLVQEFTEQGSADP